MTLRSLKKRPTTAPTSRAGIPSKARLTAAAIAPRCGLALAVVLLASPPLSWAQTTTARTAASNAAMRPVPKFGETPVTPAAPAAQGSASWNLRWRKSDQPEVAALPTAAALPDAAALPTAAERPDAAALPTAAVAEPPAIKLLSVAFQAADQDSPSPSEGRVQPVVFQSQSQSEGDSPLQLPPSLQPPMGNDQNTDIFNDALGEQTPEPAPTDDPAADVSPLPAPAPPDDLPTPRPNPMRDPASPYDRGPLPPVVELPGTDSDSLDSDQYPNPFPQDQDGAADADEPQDRFPRSAEEIQPTRVKEFSCDDFRDRIEARTIDRISLDISPQFHPEILEEDVLERTRREFAEEQAIREWRSMDGYVMARGRLKDLAYDKVHVEAEYGAVEEIAMNRISEADLAYISEVWGLPRECRIRQESFTPRNWTPSQVAWKASGLCHKPLYFEEVNLERYGHTAGPIAQPLLSSAHFFVNIVVLPYKMGIHPPTECQYTLGYYRPGSCAPWIVPPVPISLRGALAEAAVVGGFVGLIP